MPRRFSLSFEASRNVKLFDESNGLVVTGGLSRVSYLFLALPLIASGEGGLSNYFTRAASGEKD